jgi:hypothetical protein
MKFTRRKPCAHCPFRFDHEGFLTKARAVEIARSLRDPGGGDFPCHETTKDGQPRSKYVACAGSLLVVERDQGPNQMHRIAERLGLYDPSKLDRHAPCFNDLEEFIDHHAAFWEARSRKKKRRTR